MKEKVDMAAEENEMFIWYVDSFEVAENRCRKSRVEYVRQRLEVIRDVLWSSEASTRFDFKSVVLVISMAGVKMCSLDGKIVHMAHELKRVSYATCDPDFRLFAFVAREPNGELRNRQFCHIFKTDSAEQAEEINTVFGTAFRAAYAEKRKEQNKENENSQSFFVDPILTKLSAYASDLDSNISIDNLTTPSGCRSPAAILVSKTSKSQIEEDIFEKNAIQKKCNEDIRDFPPVVEHKIDLLDSSPELIGTNRHRSLSSDNVLKTDTGDFFHYQPQEEKSYTAPFPPKTYAELEQIQPSPHSSRLIDISPPVVRLRDKNVQPPKIILKSDEKQRKRRPLSAAFVFGKKEKRKEVDSGYSPNNTSGDSSNKSDSSWVNVSGDDRAFMETVSSTSALLANKRNSHSISGAGGSLFKRLFSGSTWRLPGSSTGNCEPVIGKDERILPNTNTKKRRPLSAVFAGAGASLRSAASNDKKRNSVLNLRSSVAVSSSSDVQSKFSGVHSLREASRVDRKAMSVANLESASYRVDSPKRCSPMSIPSVDRSRFGSCSVVDEGSTATRVNEEILIPLSNDEEKKLHDAAWFVEKISKDMLAKVMLDEVVGSFVVRQSSSHQCCLALTVRVPFTHNPNGISHFLILHTTRGFKLKGFAKEFPSVHALVTHHSIMPEQLPCRLVFVNRELDAFVRISKETTPSDVKRSVGTSMNKSDDEDEDESIYGITSAICST